MNPEHQAARYRLALLEVQQRQWQAAQANLEQIRHRKPEWEFNYRLALGYCAFRPGQKEEATRYAKLARTQAQGSQETQQAEALLGRLRTTSVTAP